MSQPKRKRYNWTSVEEESFKKIILDKNIIKLLDNSQYRTGNVYQIVVQEMKNLGYDRTIPQVQQKLGNMKRAYNIAKSQNNLSGNKDTETDDLMSQIFDRRPSAVMLGPDLDSEALENQLHAPSNGDSNFNKENKSPKIIDRTAAISSTHLSNERSEILDDGEGNVPLVLANANNISNEDDEDLNEIKPDIATLYLTSPCESYQSAEPYRTDSSRLLPFVATGPGLSVTPIPEQFLEPSISISERSSTPRLSVSPASNQPQSAVPRQSISLASNQSFASQSSEQSAPSRQSVFPVLSQSDSSDTESLPSCPDRSKGRGSYDNALNTFHEKWVFACNDMWDKQKQFQEQENQKQREWEEQLIEKQFANDKALIELSNSELTRSINRLIEIEHRKMRMQCSLPFPQGMPFAPHSSSSFFYNSPSTSTSLPPSSPPRPEDSTNNPDHGN